MRKILLLMAFSSLSINAQVGINVDSPTATLDVNGNARIRTVATGSGTDQFLVADTEGNIKKVTVMPSSGGPGAGSGFNSTILGYDPQPIANKVVPAAAPGGGTVTELGCKRWTGIGANNHYYCAYNLSTAITWFNAFSLAKQLGGYLVTLPNNAERIWVNTNIVASGTGYNLANNIWIGYNKIARPGNPSIFQWITGEEFKIDWSTNPANAESWFVPSEPNNLGGTEGSTHIYAAASDAQRRWNDAPGTAPAGQLQLIVEFNE